MEKDIIYPYISNLQVQSPSRIFFLLKEGKNLSEEQKSSLLREGIFGPKEEKAILEKFINHPSLLSKYLGSLLGRSSKANLRRISPFKRLSIFDLLDYKRIAFDERIPPIFSDGFTIPPLTRVDEVAMSVKKTFPEIWEGMLEWEARSIREMMGYLDVLNEISFPEIEIGEILSFSSSENWAHYVARFPIVLLKEGEIIIEEAEDITTFRTNVLEAFRKFEEAVLKKAEEIDKFATDFESSLRGFLDAFPGQEGWDLKTSVSFRILREEGMNLDGDVNFSKFVLIRERDGRLRRPVLDPTFGLNEYRIIEEIVEKRKAVKCSVAAIIKIAATTSPSLIHLGEIVADIVIPFFIAHWKRATYLPKEAFQNSLEPKVRSALLQNEFIRQSVELTNDLTSKIEKEIDDNLKNLEQIMGYPMEEEIISERDINKETRTLSDIIRQPTVANLLSLSPRGQEFLARVKTAVDGWARIVERIDEILKEEGESEERKESFLLREIENSILTKILFG